MCKIKKSKAIPKKNQMVFKIIKKYYANCFHFVFVLKNTLYKESSFGNKLHLLKYWGFPHKFILKHTSKAIQKWYLNNQMFKSTIWYFLSYTSASSCRKLAF